MKKIISKISKHYISKNMNNQILYLFNFQENIILFSPQNFNFNMEEIILSK